MAQDDASRPLTLPAERAKSPEQASYPQGRLVSNADDPQLAGCAALLNAVIDRALTDYSFSRAAFLSGGGNCVRTAAFFLFGHGPGTLEGLAQEYSLGLGVGRLRSRAVAAREKERDRLGRKKTLYLRARWEAYGRFRRAVRDGRSAYRFPFLPLSSAGKFQKERRFCKKLRMGEALWRSRN